jgi:hypothetical protein
MGWTALFLDENCRKLHTYVSTRTVMLAQSQIAASAASTGMALRGNARAWARE